MTYYYTYTYSPDMIMLETEFLNSTLVNTYDYLRWDEDDDKLKVVLNKILSDEEKQLLNNIFA